MEEEDDFFFAVLEDDSTQESAQDNQSLMSPSSSSSSSSYSDSILAVTRSFGLFLELPEDCIAYIIIRLPLRSLLSLSATSRYMQGMCLRPAAWTRHIDSVIPRLCPETETYYRSLQLEELPLGRVERKRRKKEIERYFHSIPPRISKNKLKSFRSLAISRLLQEGVVKASHRASVCGRTLFQLMTILSRAFFSKEIARSNLPPFSHLSVVQVLSRVIHVKQEWVVDIITYMNGRAGNSEHLLGYLGLLAYSIGCAGVREVLWEVYQRNSENSTLRELRAALILYGDIRVLPEEIGETYARWHHNKAVIHNFFMKSKGEAEQEVPEKEYDATEAHGSECDINQVATREFGMEGKEPVLMRSGLCDTYDIIEKTVEKLGIRSVAFYVGDRLCRSGQLDGYVQISEQNHIFHSDSDDKFCEIDQSFLVPAADLACNGHRAGMPCEEVSADPNILPLVFLVRHVPSNSYQWSGIGFWALESILYHDPLILVRLISCGLEGGILGRLYSTLRALLMTDGCREEIEKGKGFISLVDDKLGEESKRNVPKLMRMLLFEIAEDVSRTDVERIGAVYLLRDVMEEKKMREISKTVESYPYPFPISSPLLSSPAYPYIRPWLANSADEYYGADPRWMLERHFQHREYPDHDELKGTFRVCWEEIKQKIFSDYFEFVGKAVTAGNYYKQGWGHFYRQGMTFSTEALKGKKAFLDISTLAPVARIVMDSQYSGHEEIPDPIVASMLHELQQTLREPLKEGWGVELLSPQILAEVVPGITTYSFGRRGTQTIAHYLFFWTD